MPLSPLRYVKVTGALRRYVSLLHLLTGAINGTKSLAG